MVEHNSRGRAVIKSLQSCVGSPPPPPPAPPSSMRTKPAQRPFKGSARYTYLTALHQAGGGELDKASPLFRTLGGRGRKQLTDARMARQDARRMIVRRAVAAGIITKVGCHTFRATGITVYLLNGGLLEYAQQMAAHESARTTKIYDRRNDQVTLDQVERIVL